MIIIMIVWKMLSETVHEALIHSIEGEYLDIVLLTAVIIVFYQNET